MHVMLLSTCQLPSCNLFTQHVSHLSWRDTTSELWTPVHLLHLNSIYCNHLLSAFLTSNFHHPHYTINPLWSASWWDWQPHCYVGTKFFGCVVRRCWLKSYWFDNLGFFLRENLLLYSSYLPLGVSQRTCDPRTSRGASNLVAHEDLEHFWGGSSLEYTTQVL